MQLLQQKGLLTKVILMKASFTNINVLLREKKIGAWKERPLMESEWDFIE